MNPCPHCNRPLGEHSVDDGCLNAWAAGQAGWIAVHERPKLGHWFGQNPAKEPGIAGRTDIVPSYTTSIEAAFALMETFPQWQLTKYGPAGNRRYWAGLWPDRKKAVGGKTPAMAITKAFIAAMQEQDDGEG
ncbi:hypothetical protein LCGC14_0234870 [marine sediment metagenome]|uniref:Phage ABA sandwich domain-containing protein n=1 Tax=marine sediment metagenome TaxID=412755 RepID=A0A0F9WTL3_9ZZZZ